MKKRNHTFDFLCGLCIVRMVMLHTFQYTGFTVQPWWKELMDWSFYLMCFFFFKAGYFNRTTSGPTLPYLWDRTKRLLIPYITCGLIGNVLFWLFMWLLEGEYTRNPIRFLWIHVYKVSDFYGNAAMWFLFSFYIMYIAVHFIGRVRWLKWLSLAFPFLSYWLWREGNPLWMNLNNVLMGTFFFYLGHWWRLLTARTGRRTEFVISVVMLALFAVGNVEWHGVYTGRSHQHRARGVRTERPLPFRQAATHTTDRIHRRAFHGLFRAPLPGALRLPQHSAAQPYLRSRQLGRRNADAPHSVCLLHPGCAVV